MKIGLFFIVVLMSLNLAVTQPYGYIADQATAPGFAAREEIGSGGYAYRLGGGALTVTDSNGLELWRSDAKWLVQDFRLGDVDGDGVQDFLFSLWKPEKSVSKGPETAGANGGTLRCHLYLYTIINGYVKPVWCASALPRPILDFELDKSGRATPINSGMLLHTIEGRYDDYSVVIKDGVYYVPAADSIDSRKMSARTYAWGSWGFAPVD